MMTIYFQECNEDLPRIDPIHSAMMTIDNTSSNNSQANSLESVDNYLPEPQSLKAVLKLDDNVRNAWLHAINMEIKNLIDHDTLSLDKLHTKMNSLSQSNLCSKQNKLQLENLTN
ncbi:hypothetical protein MHU86_5941 [Fragilaria crotonensis]|nr:hypothetical protein MHU86_5941 [Fragilaria crotonensis]